MREELGFACGNYMYGGNTELLTSNFSPDLQDFYDRQGEYRELRPLDPTSPSTRWIWSRPTVGHPADRHRQHLDHQLRDEPAEHRRDLGPVCAEVEAQNLQS